MEIRFDTASLAGAHDQATALENLRAADLAPVELGFVPGDLAGPQPGLASACMAFLPDRPVRPNLAAGDDDIRREAVNAAREAMARCEWLGIPAYGVAAGWCLDQSVTRAGTPLGPIGLRARAVAQLARSLDRLATDAQDRHLVLGLVNMPPAQGGMLERPDQIREVVAAVGAPHIRVWLDLAAWAQAARAAGTFDPDEAAAAMAGLLGQLRFPTLRPAEPWAVRLSVALGEVPHVLVGRDLSPDLLRDRARGLEEARHALA